MYIYGLLRLRENSLGTRGKTQTIWAEKLQEANKAVHLCINSVSCHCVLVSTFCLERFSTKYASPQGISYEMVEPANSHVLTDATTSPNVEPRLVLQ